MKVTHYASFVSTAIVATGEDRYEIKERLEAGCVRTGTYTFRKISEVGSTTYECRPADQTCSCEGRRFGWDCRHLNMIGALLARHYFDFGSASEPADIV